MRKLVCLSIAAVLVVFLSSAGLAGARDDVRVRSERDEKRNTVYYLVNVGDRTVRAKVRLKKTCTSLANAQRPTVREYWVGAGKKVEIGKAWPRTTCRRDYRVVEARYP